MKILMQNRRDHFKQNGGDVIQIENTKKSLEKLFDVEVDISTSFDVNLEKYDIVHLFNITRVHENVKFMNNAIAQCKPVVLTPIFHDLDAIYKYEENGRYGFIKYINKLLRNQTHREFIKNIAKAIRNSDFEQMGCIFSQLKQGYEKQQKYVVENADFIFPIAESEMVNIKKQLKIEKDKNFIVTPNGIDFNLSYETIDLSVYLKNIDFSKRRYVISVGRIEPRKNQLGVIRALKDTEIGVIFVGDLNKKHKKYCKEFLKNIDSDKYIYLGKVEHNIIMNLYKQVNVSVLPSWFEVTSLVDLEAYLSGLKVVSTKYSYIGDFLGNNIRYCDPADVNSIRESILSELNSPNHYNIRNLEEKISKYNWDYTAEKVYEGYKLVLSNFNKK